MNNSTLLITYKRYRNFCNTLLRKLKHEYEKHQFHEAQNNPQAMWGVINSISGRKCQSPTATELLQMSTNAKKSAYCVNKLFVNIRKELAPSLLSSGSSTTRNST